MVRGLRCQEGFTAMNKTQLIRRVAKKAGVSIENARNVVNALFDTKGVLVNAMRAGERVTIPGFGSFRPSERDWHWARNPSTGEDIRVPPVRRMTLKVAGVAKARIRAGLARTPDPMAPPPRKSGLPDPKTEGADLDPADLEDEDDDSDEVEEDSVDEDDDSDE